MAVIALFALTMLSCGAQKVYTPAAVPNVHRLNGSTYVSDPENILSPSAVSQLNRMAAALEASAGVETAIVVVPSIGNDTPEDFSVRLFQLWGIGKKGTDNGLLILLITVDRYIRFEVGYGLEGVLTDAMSKRIQTQRMNRYLSTGDWDNGLVAGMGALSELLTDPDSELLAPDTAQDSNYITGLLIVLGLMIAITVSALLSYRRKLKCPRCGHRMEVVNESSQRISPVAKRITTVMRCPNCGYTTTKNRTENIGGAITGGMIGGMGGLGRGGGGSFGGGGWGGGRSGGGGATSRF